MPADDIQKTLDSSSTPGLNQQKSGAIIRFVIFMFFGDFEALKTAELRRNLFEIHFLGLLRVGIIHRTYPQAKEALIPHFTMSKKRTAHLPSNKPGGIVQKIGIIANSGCAIK